mgnify:CR=1 FL=1
MRDEDLLCSQNEVIYNAVYNAICALSPDTKPEWDMAVIGEATDSIVEIMQKMNLETCYPWQNENEDICYSQQAERCAYCKHDMEMSM